ncbi:MAG: signal recognition particle protein [Flavobacteriales bacterium]|nr:MAG: signal recognition particle protein [Flavobacteriales bacterium]
MFDNLSSKLESAFKVLKGQGKISEINVAETIKEIRRALLDADVNFKIAKEFTNKVKEKALGRDVINSINPGQLMTKIVKDELAELMGEKAIGLNLINKPSIILMSGLQGSGKTTLTGKLAHFLKNKKHKKPYLIACDIHRPAAIDQLEVLSEDLKVPVFSDRDEKDPVKIALGGIKKAKKENCDVILIDTAGRLAIDNEMMDEISKIHSKVKPDETLFVVDSMTGQDAINTAKAFNDILNFDGVVLTKLDGDTRGGAALSIRTVVDKPIKFIGTGEKMDALDIFYPERMADRILGMGDVVSLVERAQQQFDEEKARKISKKIAKNQFGFDDFLTQIEQIKKMGNVKDLMGMIPGMSSKIKDIDIDNDSFRHIEAMIKSMTLEERKNPNLMNQSRKSRIALGSGQDIGEVNKMIKQFFQMSKMMKIMQGGKANNMLNMMQNFGK